MSFHEDAEKEAVGESWRKEYDRIILSRKMNDASRALGIAASYPSEDNIIQVYGMIKDALAFMPVGKKERITERDTIVKKLDDVQTILYGNRHDQAFLALAFEWHVGKMFVRRGGRAVEMLTNLPVIVKKLEEILLALNDFTVNAGLRIVLHENREKGLNKLLKEEGFDELV